MPRYHFNVYDGIDLLDQDGVELPDATVARREAIRYAGALLEDGAEQNSIDKDWRLEVVDETELVLFRLDIHITDSPAVSFAKGHS